MYKRQESIETLKERVRVKIKDGDSYIYRKYDAKDIKVIKDIGPVSYTHLDVYKRQRPVLAP